MAYSHLTRGQLKTELANRLADSGKVFWLDAELTQYVNEALRTWGALTCYWRERGTFATAASTSFYDLSSQVSLLNRTVTDRTLINVMQYHLLETATSTWSGGWTGTEMFTMDDLSNAIRRRRDQFLMDTGIVLARSTQVVGASPIGRVTLADTIIDVRRAVWQPVTGAWIQVTRSDEYAMTAYSSSWSVNQDTPQNYSIMATRPVELQLAPPPVTSGTLDILTVNAGGTLDPVNSATTIAVPDDWTWAVKWGAMADLLSRDGQARDPSRAEYCDLRYRMAVELARRYPTVVNCQINGSPVQVSPLQALDAYDPGWQGKTTGTPSTIGMAQNLMALNPVPNGVFSVTADVVRQAPIPADDGANVQIGREQVDAILDYAEHLAAFKMGGTEFQITSRLFQNFIEAASEYNHHVAAAARYVLPAVETDEEENERRPRRLETAAGVGRAR